ncbi:TetR family transcriptional regulator [Dongia sp.]|uniref:TetR family transcriptional regulator n=1 Tax=Dongia sp. TaxID=1977262 RepID=UPI0035AFCE9F
MAKAAGAAKKPAERKKAARSKTAGGQTAGSKAHPADAAAAMRAALLQLMATQGWCDLSLAAIAEEAGLDMAAAHATYPTKAAILLGLARATDEDILNSLKDDPLDGSGRDRLFDLLMRRFDHLQQHRDAYLTLLHELPRTPLEAACLAKQVRRSMALMLETAGVSASGLKGLVRVQGLMAIYGAGLHAWRRDDSADLAKTMAEIDKRLGQAVKITEMLQARRAAA